MMRSLEDNDFILVLTLIFLSAFAIVIFCSLPCSTKCLTRLYYKCFVNKGRHVEEDGSRWHSSPANGIFAISPPPPSTLSSTPRFTFGFAPFTTTACYSPTIVNLSSPMVSQANSIFAIDYPNLHIYNEIAAVAQPPSYETIFPNPPTVYTSTNTLNSNSNSNRSSLGLDESKVLYVDTYNHIEELLTNSNELLVQDSVLQIKPRTESE